MTYLRKPRKDGQPIGKPKPEQIRCRSNMLIDVRDKALVVKAPPAPKPLRRK